MSHQIEVTVEKTYRVCGVTTVSDEEYEAITKDGEEPTIVSDMLTSITDDGDATNYDYAVWDPEIQKTIVNWSNCD